MDNYQDNITGMPEEQLRIRAKCFHPSGTFVEFKGKEIEQSIPERFEKQVNLYPDRIAVKSEEHQFTYRTLNNAANRLARTVVSQRKEGEGPVALILEQEAPAIMAIFGVLKAGKICVPIDPLIPLARIEYILKDSQATLVVTDNKNLSLAGEVAGDKRQLLNIDKLDSSLSPKNLCLSISPDTRCYLLYTSGSTGQPKGVCENHRNLLYDSRLFINDYHICMEDRIALMQSFCFAGSIRRIYPALLAGAGLYMRDIKKKGLNSAAKWLAQEEITISSVRHLLRNCIGDLTARNQFPKLRLAGMGGDTIYRRDVELYKKHFCEDTIMIIRFSTTETESITRYFIDKKTRVTESVAPAGYAVEGKEVLLLDKAGRHVGFNQIGEIAVKSRYLTLGYWHKPDLTKTKFLPDAKAGDTRIYLTGDLGRMLPDGCLIHMGRKDFQVKIRGYRVETAEVEMALLEIAAISRAVVVAGEDRSGDKRLVAYIVPFDKPAPTVTALRRALSNKLPDYLIPSVFMILDTLPLTANGKVDRLSLPAPGTERPHLDSLFVPPRTPVEETLAGIWSHVLGLDEVGIYDNFFGLGGHSLLATQIISRVLKTFRVNVSLQALFKAPTVADMSLVIIQNQANKAGRTDIDRMLDELESLADGRAKRFPDDEKAGFGRR